jgi:hypothetical protein
MEGKILSCYVDSELYQAGRDEDGQPYTAEVYLVCLEFKSGEVYAHNEHFKGCNPQEVDDGEEVFTYFEDIREQAKARADKLQARVQACLDKGGKPDPQFWHFHRTIYGSGAYLQEVAEMTPSQRAGEPD